MGMTSTTPTIVAVRLGAIMSKAANKQESCSQRFISTNMNLLNAAAMSVMPKTQPVKVMMKLSHVKPLVTNSREGENTNTNGTKALAKPKRKAVLPVLKGSLPAIPAVSGKDLPDHFHRFHPG
mgnify:CR=1 FL=1